MYLDLQAYKIICSQESIMKYENIPFNFNIPFKMFLQKSQRGGGNKGIWREGAEDGGIKEDSTVFHVKEPRFRLNMNINQYNNKC